MVFDQFFDLLMSLEGGYSDLKQDKGGKTNFGITEKTLRYFNNLSGTKFTIENLTKDQAKTIYLELYFNPIKPVNNLPVYYHYFDICVNSGYGEYKNCKKDCNDDIGEIIAWRRKKYQSIVDNDKSQIIFLKGWLNRIILINKHFNVKV